MENPTTANYPENKQAGLNNYCTGTGENIHTACSVFGKTVAGVGVGVVTGLSLVVAAAVAEVAVPAILLLKALGLTGGAFGFINGLKKD